MIITTTSQQNMSSFFVFVLFFLG